MAHLFIGGPVDGHRIVVPHELDRWNVEGPEPDAPSRYELGEGATKLRFPRVVRYRKERFAVEKRIAAEIFVADGVSTETMFRLLLEGYRQGLPPDPPEIYEKGFAWGWNAAIRHVATTIREEQAKQHGSLYEVVAGSILRLVEAMRR